jgi:hypothetical protein
MPIKTITPPSGSHQIISDAISTLADPAAGPAPASIAGAPAALDLAAPHPTFTLGLEDLKAGRGTDAAYQTGVRFFVLDANDTRAAATVREDAGGTAFSGLNQGPYVIGTMTALERVEGHPALQDRDYELRVLEVPALYVFALWLHGAEENYLVPIPPTPPELTPYELIPENAFVASLVPRAEALIIPNPDDPIPEDDRS